MAKKKPNTAIKSEDTKNTLYCSFCGKSQHEVLKLIAGPTVFICDECVELCSDIVREENRKFGINVVDENDREQFFSTMKDLAHANDEVMEALFDIASSANLIAQGKISRAPRILLCGPLGSGKDLVANAYLRTIDQPYCRFRASNLWHKDFALENFAVQALLGNADYNIERAQRGVVFIDGLDAIADQTREANLSAQEHLVSVMNSESVNVFPIGGRKHPQQEFLKVNTQSVSFVAASILPFYYEEFGEGGWGLHPRAARSIATRDRLIASGYLPELINTFDIILECTIPDELSLQEFLSSPEKIQSILEIKGINGDIFDFTENEKVAIAAAAHKNNCGFRSLRSLLSMVYLRRQFSKKDVITSLIELES